MTYPGLSLLIILSLIPTGPVGNMGNDIDVIACASESPGIRSQTGPGADLFDEVWRLCVDHFYNPAAMPDWESLKKTYRPRVENAASEQQAAAVINSMLSELKISHTHLYTRSDWEYYDLLDVFQEVFAAEIRLLFPNGKVTYPSMGVFTQDRNGKIFVKAVLDGSPAAKSGIRAGDEVIAVDGAAFDPIKSFAGKHAATVQVQRTGDPASRKQIRVSPEQRTPGERYLEAMKASARIIRVGSRRIGYIHIWSFAGEQFYLELLRQMQSGILRDADALILDLRDGWGGANPYYLNPFDPAVPTEVPSAEGKNKSIPFKWKRPVVLLVNGGTRSGKETLVYNFKLKKLGTVVGSRTAGASVPGRPFLLKRGSLLMLAVRGPGLEPSRPVPPNPIEGVGVAPDIILEFPLEYAGGKDPQLNAAVDAAIKMVKRPGTPQ